MTLLERLRGAVTRSLPRTYAPLNSPQGFSWFSGNTMSDTGEIINEHNALQISTCYAAVRVLSESVASLPCRLYRATEQGRTQAMNHVINHLLLTSPNDEMTAFTFFEVLVKSMALCGNAYAEIERDADGEVIALWPLHPRQTNPVRLDNGGLAYQTTDGMNGGQARTIEAADLLHIPLFPTFDGLVGLSPLQVSAQTFGQARAVERFGSRFFRNYATPALALSTDANVRPEDKLKMRGDWEAMHAGDNQHRVAILDNGLKIQQLSLSAEDAQYLETRKFLREEIAALYNVPPHRLGSDVKLSNSNVENMNLSFVVDTLRPYLSRLESELTRKLFPIRAGVPALYSVSFDVSERQRGDFASSMAGFASGRQWGYLTANDCRRALGYNEAGPEGDVLLNPVNMQNANQLLSAGTAPAN